MKKKKKAKVIRIYTVQVRNVSNMFRLSVRVKIPSIILLLLIHLNVSTDYYVIWSALHI